VHQRADGRGADRLAHMVPVNRRAGVEDHVALHAGHNLAGRKHVHQDLLRFEHPPQRDLVRAVNRNIPRAGQRASQVGIAFGWWSPVNTLDGYALSCERVGEQRRACADHAQITIEQAQVTTPSSSKFAASAASYFAT